VTAHRGCTSPTPGAPSWRRRHRRGRADGRRCSGCASCSRHENVFFDDHTAAEADITVRRDGRILLAVAEDAVPRERGSAISTWLRFADEVWIVDLRGRAVIVARPDAPRSTLIAGDTLTTPAVPGLTIALAEVFA
jgi:ferredoxin